MSENDNCFPVLRGGGDLPKFVKWRKLSEFWAQKNHSQSLERLAERGGLSPIEIVGNVEGIDWIDLSSVSEERARDLVKKIAQDA